MDGEASEPGHALQHRYQEKWRKYGDACQAEGIQFQPVAISVLGGYHPSGEAVVKRLGASLARQGGLEEAETVRHLFQRLSILLMRGNTQLILSRCPTHPDPMTDGNL